MTGEQDAMTFIPQSSKQAPESTCRHYVEPIGGFIEHDVAGRVHQRARDRNLEPLTLGVALGTTVHDLAHLQQFHQLTRTPSDGSSIESLQPTEVVDVLAAGEVGVD